MTNVAMLHICRVFEVFYAGVFSAYERPQAVDGSSIESSSAPLNGNGIRAVWMLMLALLFKMASTIVTYGIKVTAADMFMCI